MVSTSPTYEPGLSLPETARGPSALYAALTATVFAALFYTNVPTYGGMFLWAVQPIHFMMALGLAAFPLLLGRDGLKIDLRTPFVLWCLIYLLICSLSYALLGGGAYEPLQLRILAVIFMLTFYVLFVRSARLIIWVRYALIGCVLLGVAMNIYDISHPFALVPATSEFSLIGRAAGLYVNPNPAGLALLMGFVLSVELLPARWRTSYALVVGIGIALTASRAAMGALGLVMLILTFAGVFRFRQLVWMSLSATAAGWLLWTWFGAQLAAVDIDWTALYERAQWFLELGERNDFSQRERALLAEKAWLLAANHPFVGAGLGSTELWNERSSTHNMFLMMMADFGVLGVFIFPALVCASAGGLTKIFRRDRLAFSALALTYGLVSHNLIGDYYFMLAVALMAAMSHAEDGERGLQLVHE
jgi:O-antigen ligase